MAGDTPEANGTVPHRGLITVCVMAATLMQALDSTIANVALPYMQGGLSATQDQAMWILTSYIIAAAIMMAPVGYLAGQYGRKRVFLISVAGFTIASMLCGMAQSLGQMVLFRLLQGVFGAALVPLSQATMLDIYHPEERGSAMAVWGMGVMVGPILGPTLGGWLTNDYSWRWVFYINLPFGILAFLGLLVFMQHDRQSEPRRFDWLGFGVLSLFLGAFQIMLDRGELKNWFSSPEIIVEAILAGTGLYLFLVHMATAENPFIPPRLFRDRNIAAALVVMFVVGVVLFATSALLAPYLQTLSNYPVFTAGLLMAPRGLGTMFAMLIAGRIANKVDPRAQMAFGTLVMCWTLWEMTAWTPDVDEWWFATITVVQGFGLGFVFIPLQVVAFATLDPALRTDGTAMLSLVRNIGSAIGISVCQALLTRNTQLNHAQIAEHATPFNRAFSLPGVEQFWNLSTAHGLTALNAEVTRQAQIISYVADFKLLLLLSLPLLPLFFLMKRPARAAGAEAGHAALD